ncbi:MAG: Lrp/AsnC family transcriptional regulator [Rhodobacteraceae bacterium]|nr:Lrp/AsnC family transcriptional regulator [Paracoccaceae bacterium]
MEKLGIIKSYRATLLKKKVGLGISCFIQVSLNNHGQKEIQAFGRLLENNPSILEACKLTGPMDYLLRAATADLDEMNQLISDILLPIPVVSHLQSHIVLERLKEDGVLAVKMGLTNKFQPLLLVGVRRLNIVSPPYTFVADLYWCGTLRAISRCSASAALWAVSRQLLTETPPR